MKLVVAAVLFAISLAYCSHRNSGVWRGGTATETRSDRNSMSEDEKHRLYTAALAAGESPLDTKLFSDVCKKIGIHDIEGQATDKYMSFVQAHIDWATRPENEQFRREINSPEKARGYVTTSLSAE